MRKIIQMNILFTKRKLYCVNIQQVWMLNEANYSNCSLQILNKIWVHTDSNVNHINFLHVKTIKYYWCRKIAIENTILPFYWSYNPNKMVIQLGSWYFSWVKQSDQKPKLTFFHDSMMSHVRIKCLSLFWFLNQQELYIFKH